MDTSFIPKDASVPAALNLTSGQNVPITDMSNQMLSNLFGNLGPFHGSDNIFAGIMPMWSSIAFILAGIIVAYTVFVGLIKTAHDGEVLGQKWSSIWIPLRSAAAIGLLLPVAGGFSIAQHGVGYGIGTGIYFADNIWVSGVDWLAKTGGSVTAPHLSDKSFSVIKSAWLQNVCVAAINDEQIKMAAPGTAAPQLALHEFDTSKMSIASSLVLNSELPKKGFIWTNPVLGDNCGGFSWGITDTVKTRAQLADAQGILHYDWAEVANGKISDAVTDEQQFSTKQLLTYFKPIAEKFVKDGTKPKFEEMQAAVKMYSENSAKVIANSTQWAKTTGMTGFVEDAKKDGWASAGVYFNKINNLNKSLQEAASSGSTTIGLEIADSATLGEDFGQSIQLDMTEANAIIDNMQKLSQPGTSSAYDQEVGQGIGFSPGAAITHGVLSVLQSDANPLTRMQAIGNTILDVIGVGAAIEVGKDVLPVGRVSGALKSLSDKISSGKESKMAEMGSIALFSLFTIGMILAIVLPMTPYVLWTLGIFSWMVSCVIAITATPIWIAAHASPEGHDVSGAGTNGYPILLGLLLRPVLMTMGVFMAILLMNVGDWFLTKTFMASFALANTNNVIGPFIIFGNIGLYCVLVLMLVYSSFRIIQTLPDAILSWIGGRSDDAIGVESHADKANVIVGGGISNVRNTLAAGMKNEKKEAGGESKTASNNENLIQKDALV